MTDNRQIVRVVWHEHSEEIFIVYDAGESDHLVGTRSVASEFAADVGLQRELVAHGTVQWERQEAPSDSPS